MKRFKSLSRSRKALLLYTILVCVVITAFTVIETGKEWYVFKNAYLVKSEQPEGTVYSGKLAGKPVQFTVTADQTVSYRYGGQEYVPVTVVPDAGAISRIERDHGYNGVTIRAGETTAFRGGYAKVWNSRDVLYHCVGEEAEEDKSGADLYLDAKGSFIDSWEMDKEVIDPLGESADGRLEGEAVEVKADTVFEEEASLAATEEDPWGELVFSSPTLADLIELTTGPELVHRGRWDYWLIAMLICGYNACSILFAKELFRFQMSFRLRNAEAAEPSEFEVTCWYFSWVMLPLLAVALCLLGLA